MKLAMSSPPTNTSMTSGRTVSMASATAVSTTDERFSAATTSAISPLA
jgi:hypothetical protein